jgi:hypothetical protein
MALALAEPQVIETLLPLTQAESKRLRECEKAIERGLDTFYQVGNALAEIRESRLYRISYATFEDYCLERWKMSRPRAYQLMGAASVLNNLSTIVDKPTTESQARELASFEPDVQKAVWQIAIGTAPTNDRGEPVITAAHIKSVADVLTDVVQSGGLDDGSGEIKPLGVLIDAAVTEETYERVMRQKAYIKEKSERAAEEKKAKREHKIQSLPPEADALVLSEVARQFLDDYMVEIAQWTAKIPPEASEAEREVLEKMIYEQGADVARMRKRTVRSDCEAIVKVMKDTEAASHSGEMSAADLYAWMESLRYFMAESEFKERLEYMTLDSVRMVLLTDAGKEGKQEDRRGSLPGIVCFPWRKIWDQGSKRERDEDDDD